jgi:hypothetical protein
LAALVAAQSVDTTAVSLQARAAGVEGSGIGQWIHAARVAAVAATGLTAEATADPPTPDA